MAMPLLKTKLYIPPVRPELVPRPRLIERLNGGLDRKLTLISAPAGFGKTTLLSEWVAGTDQPVAWISLDERDNDPVRFFTYLGAALQRVDYAIGQAMQGLLGTPQLPPTETLVTTLINDIAAVPEAFVLVLDDYHVIHTLAIHDALEFLLDHQPPTFHLVLLTRQDPPLPLARLRVRGQLVEFRADDLRFSTAEAATFLNTALGTTLDEAIVAALEARTEGWIAGLQLAAVSMRGRRDVTRFVESFCGCHRYVMDYLAEEVLQQQPDDIRLFLRQTAILERLGASLCEAVTGRKDSQALLAQLEQSNLFLVPLDDQREWYRYHHLFADLLRTELAPEQQKRLHALAARWYESNGFPYEAIRHTLAAGQIDKATATIGHIGDRLIRNGELTMLLDWLSGLPDEVVRADVRLATYKAWCLLLTGQYEDGMSYADSAAERLSPDADKISRGRIRLLEAYAVRQSADEACTCAEEAADLLGEDDPPFSTMALLFLANQQTLSDLSSAIATYRRVVQIARQERAVFIEMTALNDLLDALDMQGRRREAVELAQGSIAYYANACGEPQRICCIDLLGIIYIKSGMLAYAADDLSDAERAIQQGLAYSRQSAFRTWILVGMQLLALVQDAEGAPELALATISEARRLAEQVNDELAAAHCSAIKAEFLIAQGGLTGAEQLLSTIDLSQQQPPSPYHALPHIAQARLLVAQNRLQEARSRLAALARWAEANGCTRFLITILVLQAQAALMRGNAASGRLFLSRAVELAAPQGYRRDFLGADRSITALLPEVRYAAPAFVDELLARIPRAKAAPPLLDPLTKRELEVLRLIADDLTNQEIADRLVIAVGTAKKHINRIFSKLAARDRTHAVVRARELGLL